MLGPSCLFGLGFGGCSWFLLFVFQLLSCIPGWPITIRRANWACMRTPACLCFLASLRLFLRSWTVTSVDKYFQHSLHVLYIKIRTQLMIHSKLVRGSSHSLPHRLWLQLQSETLSKLLMSGIGSVLITNINPGSGIFAACPTLTSSCQRLLTELWTLGARAYQHSRLRVIILRPEDHWQWL